MFQRVPYTNLVVGEKYRIYCHCNVYKGIYDGMNHDTIYNLMFSKGQKNILFSKQDLFYKFVSDNPQATMERRAVNLIVRQLIGDVHFTW